MKTVLREDYLKRLRDLRDIPIIKVVTGVRRCGKSTLLALFRSELLNEGVPRERITALSFEEPENSYLASWHQVYEKVADGLQDGGKNYVFLDEVQYIDGFERLLTGLCAKENVDLYVTGSNAHMLSSELATLLTGRSYEVKMLPLSFAEYVSAFEGEGMGETSFHYKRFNDYLNHGGFPQAVSVFHSNPDLVHGYLEGVYATIIQRDIFARRRSYDQQTFGKVAKYLFDNIGNFASASKIADVLTDDLRKANPKAKGVSHHTVADYIRALVDGFLVYPIGRLHIKGKELLRTQEKYYAVDLGLRAMLLGREAGSDMGHMLENVVYLELLRRGGNVWVGKTAGDKEVDFVVRDNDGYTSYYQVAYTAREEKTLERELAPLKAIKDHSPKYLITMDEEEPTYDGIRKVYVVDWLLKK